MKFSLSTVFLIASLAGSILALSDADMMKLNLDPHCFQCLSAMPCMKGILAGAVVPEGPEFLECVCNERVYSVFESQCLKCSVLMENSTPEDPSNTLQGLKQDCAAALSPPSSTSSIETSSSKVPSTSNTPGPTQTTNGSSSIFVLSTGAVTIAALVVTLMA
ncbi:hypothetical protein K7432_011172 [Basidiobolus ranarum]|uniref:Uncharacterized protein n=1 Tax=Basidiobolus ranarum TaxID=34480 RepID=A0ABR2WMS6_9FUNG